MAVSTHSPSPMAAKSHRYTHRRSASLRDYAPIAIIIVLALLTAAASTAHAAGAWSGREWMLDAMGFFLVIFSMFKFFDLRGFADGFQMYDLLAKRVRAYALVYPFIELGLALGYLARWQLPLVYAVTIVVMAFGALGVINALRHKLNVECACMGTVLHVPLSTVALTEDLGMAAMAAMMLLR